jgi:hypothetical protein
MMIRILLAQGTDLLPVALMLLMLEVRVLK